MRIVKCQQGTEEWLDARLGLVTASEVDALITSKWKIKDMDDAGPQTYLFTKIAENWLSKSLEGFTSFATEQGILLEKEARADFKIDHKCEIETVGFIVGDDRRCGCSPDGIIGNEAGVEIKCPQPTNAVRYAINGVLPPDYELQVHFSMFVSGFKRWHFLSYHRTLPKLDIVIERDKEKCATIGKALAAFYAAFDSAWEKLNETADEPRANPYLKNPTEPTL